MPNREFISVNGNSFDENIYLSKILLFTKDAHQIAEQLMEYSESTVSTNCINTIGMYPLISRIETSLGMLCMSIWIISDDERFEQFRMAYYSGASHSIILNRNQEEYNSLDDLYLITPQGVPTTILTIAQDQSNFNKLPASLSEHENRRAIYFKTINDLSLLSTIFYEIGQKIADDIRSGEYQTFTPQLVKPSKIFKLYNKKSFDKVQNLVNRLGYNLQESGVVTLTKDIYTFDIDFYRNQVKANITSCLSCVKHCKHYRKLCVVEEDQGFSNFVHFDNLRALAILYSIHDCSFASLTGERPRENIQYQLRKLRLLYEANCPFFKEEQMFQEINKKSKKNKKRKLHLT